MLNTADLLYILPIWTGVLAASGAGFHREDSLMEIDGMKGLESVCGLLEITLDSDTLVTGVAFRAGDRHVITAFHSFRGCFEQIAENIAYHVDKKTDTSHRKDVPLISTGSDKETKYMAILNFLLIPPTMGIERLIKKFEEIDKTGYANMDNMLNQRWYNGAVKVSFGNSVATLSPDIPFFDEKHDVIILEIEKSTKPGFRLWLESKTDLKEYVDVVGYIRNEDKSIDTMKIDDKCKVYEPGSENLKKDVKNAVKYWKTEEAKLIDKEGSSVDFEAQYTLPDTSSGRFVLHTSHPFVEGTSGSPIVSLKTENGKNRLVVHGMYLEGYPPFYYTVAQSVRSGKVLPEEDRNLNKYKEIVQEHEEQRQKNKWTIPFSHFFEVGISMKKIASLLQVNNCEELKNQLFPTSKVDINMEQDMENLAIEYEKFLQERKSKDNVL